MRSFPRIARRRLAAACLAAALALGAVTAPANGDDKLKDRQKQVRQNIKAAQGDLHESSKAMSQAHADLEAAKAKLTSARQDLGAARVRLSAAQADVTTAQERDEEMQAELALAELKLEQSREDLVNARVAMKAQLAEVRDVITGLYTQGDPQISAFAGILDANDPADLTRSNEAHKVWVDNEDRAYVELKTQKIELAAKEREVEADRDDVEVKRQAAADHLAQMQGLENAAASAEADVETLVGQREAARDEASAAKVAAAKAKAADVRRLEQLRKEEDRVEEMLKKRALAALRRQRAAAAAAAAAAAQQPSAGLLGAPVAAEVTSPYGYRIHPIYGYWGLHNGIDFGSSCGDPMYAAADGQVISRYYSGVYGNRLIIDDGVIGGAGVATIYNHATSYTVDVGAQVKRGDLIGYVGDTGWSTACHLHFIVMANGQAVDPALWL